MSKRYRYQVVEVEPMSPGRHDLLEDWLDNWGYHGYQLDAILPEKVGGRHVYVFRREVEEEGDESER